VLLDFRGLLGLGIEVVELCFELGTAAAGKLMAASIQASQAAELKLGLCRDSMHLSIGCAPIEVLALTA
jgi:hypothetical protein